MTSKTNQILIAYFSYSGNTRCVAEIIQEAIDGCVDVFEIKPVEKYPSNYSDCVRQAREECSGKYKPELAGQVKDMDKYDTVFIGTPNWCSTIAPPVLSFLSNYDFSGKTVIPFVTHGGGGVAQCEMGIRKVCGKSEFGKGGVFSGRGSKAEVTNWVNNVIV